MVEQHHGRGTIKHEMYVVAETTSIDIESTRLKRRTWPGKRPLRLNRRSVANRGQGVYLFGLIQWLEELRRKEYRRGRYMRAVIYEALRKKVAG